MEGFKFATTLLLFLSLPAASLAIDCYECDEIPGSSYKTCPGANIIKYGEKYDACIIYRLNTGRIVFQHGVISTARGNLCSEAPGKLQMVIQTNFRQPGTPMCCRTDGCNKDIPFEFEGQENSMVLYLEDYRRESGSAGGGDKGGGGGGAQNFRGRQESSGTRTSYSVLVTLLFPLMLVLRMSTTTMGTRI